MINFFDRIYLLLTLKAKEFKSQVLSAVSISAIILVYCVAATYLGLYPLVNYYAVLVGIGLVFLFYLSLWTNRLDIDWELLEAVEKAKNEVIDEEKKDDEIAVIVEEIEEVTEEELPTNEEIQMVQDEDDEFDFGDPLEDLYAKGTPRQLADHAVNSTTNKVNEMLE